MQTGKQYDIRAVARDRAGNVSEVKQVTNTTKTNTAPKVTDVSVSSINSYSFTVKFKATDAEGDSLNYKLTWGTSMTDQSKQDTEYVLGEDGYVYMVARDLTKITTYTFRVWAYDETDDKLFGYSDYKTAKTWCDGRGVSCTGFTQCGICGGDSICNHPSAIAATGGYYSSASKRRYCTCRFVHIDELLLSLFVYMCGLSVAP